MASYASDPTRRSAIAGYYQQHLGRSAQDSEIDYWAGGGQALETVQGNIAGSQEASNRRNSAFTTVPGQLTNSGLGGLVELGNKYKDNETIGGLVAGTLADTFKTQVNTGSALAYNDAFMGSLGKYQQGLETLKKGNAMELMAAEGRIAKDLQADQLATSRYLGDQELSGSKYKADQDLAGTRFAADKGLEGIKYKSDADLAGTKYGYDSQERQIGLTGEEARKLERTKTDQTLALRRDARGAIARSGQRFFG